MTPEIVRENDFLLQKQNGLTTVVGYTGKEDCLTLPAAAEAIGDEALRNASLPVSFCLTA